MVEEFLVIAFLENLHLPILGRYFKAAGSESAAIDNFFRSGGDVDKAAASDRPAIELAHVHIAEFIDFSHSQECLVDAAAVVPIEHVRVADEGFGVVGHAEIGPAGRYAAYGADLGGERQHVRHAFMRSDRCKPVGYPDAQIDHGFCREFQGCAAQDEQSLVEGKLAGVRREA